MHLKVMRGCPSWIDMRRWHNGYRLGKEKGHLSFGSGLLQVMTPHSGHSSQLVFDANDRCAQFLPTGARSALVQRVDSTLHGQAVRRFCPFMSRVYVI